VARLTAWRGNVITTLKGTRWPTAVDLVLGLLMLAAFTFLGFSIGHEYDPRTQVEDVRVPVVRATPVPVPGPAVPVIVRTAVPGPVVTVPVPGPAVTRTRVVTVPGPTVTVTVPGPTVTVPVPGPTVTVPVPGPTVTVTVPAPAPS
jgi:hypothetical protein